MKFTSTLLLLSASAISSVTAAPAAAADGAAPAIICQRGSHYECWIRNGKEGCGCVPNNIGKRSVEAKGCMPRQYWSCWTWPDGTEGCGCVDRDVGRKREAAPEKNIGKRSPEGKGPCMPRQYWSCWIWPDGTEGCGCVDRDVGRKREAAPKERCGPFTHWECWGPNDCGCVSNGGPHHG